MPTEKTSTVLILGAGLAGLSAGYELAKKGYRVKIIEKQKQVGGLAQTIEYKGFRFDSGPHRWYTKSNFVNKWMLNLLGNEVIKVPRLTRIYFDNNFFYYPIRIKNALAGIGLKKSTLAIIDYLIARIRARLIKRKLISMEDGYINQFGRTLYEIFFKRYSEKLWGDDCRKISVDWVGQRTRGLSILTIVKDAFFKNKQVVSLVDEFSYPKYGIGRIADKLAASIEKYGGEVIIDAEVIKLKYQNNNLTTIIVRQGKRLIQFKANHFISSIPIDDLVSNLKPTVPKKILMLAKKLQYRDELQVALFINREHITPDTWIYIHPKEIPYMRVMEMDNWSSKLSPKGTTTLVFEIACNAGSKMWNKKDNDIITMVKKSFIKEFKLIKESDVIGGYVHRVQKEYPVYHLGYKEDVNLIKNYLRSFTNLQLVGRNGTFRYNNMDHSVEMGLYSAWNIIQGKKLYDIESVNIEREYLEEKRLENIEDESLEKH